MAEATSGLLARIIEDSRFLTLVRELDARTLGRVVQHVGLEDAGDIVALASAEQLRDMFDEDLWVVPEPGQEEKFDAQRFALWLEIMLESGEQFVVDKLLELPEDLVTLGLQRQVFVLDTDELAMVLSERPRGVDMVEKALELCQYEEIDQFRVIARQHEHWDAVLTVLLALDQNHHSYLRKLLERCCYATTEYIDDNGGLYEVLTSEEMLEADAAAERDDRRAAEGFVSSADAAAFLALPRVNTLKEVLASSKRDPITAAYFRSISTQQCRQHPPPETGNTDMERLTTLLEDAGIVERPTHALPAGGPAGGPGGGPGGGPDSASAGVPSSKVKRPPAFQRAIAALLESEPSLYARRTEELGYLTNVLVTGSSFAGRAFRPVEAAEAAICTCNLGLELLRSESAVRASSVVREHSADHLFRIGWCVLCHDVGMRAAEELRRRLADRDAPDRLVSLVRSAIADQKPWLIRPKLRPKGTLWNPTELEVFQHLLDRCPKLPPKKSVRGVASSVCFFATRADIASAHRLLEGG